MKIYLEKVMLNLGFILAGASDEASSIYLRRFANLSISVIEQVWCVYA